jgi:hypothetical protein
MLSKLFKLEYVKKLLWHYNPFVMIELWMYVINLWCFIIMVENSVDEY